MYVLILNRLKDHPLLQLPPHPPVQNCLNPALQKNGEQKSSFAAAAIISLIILGQHSSVAASVFASGIAWYNPPPPIVRLVPRIPPYQLCWSH